MELVVLLVLLVPSCYTASHGNCSTESELRLSGRQKCSYAGYLEVCWHLDQKPLSLQWYRVCNLGLNDVAASVVCRKLGFNRTLGHRAAKLSGTCHVTMSCQNGGSMEGCSPATATLGANAKIPFGVICNVSPQEMESCLSAQCPTPPPIMSPSASLPTTITSTIQHHVSQQEMHSCLSASLTHSSIITPSACQQTTTIVPQCTPSSPPIITPSEDMYSCDCFTQNMSSASGMQDGSLSSSNKAEACNNHSVVLVGGILGAVIGVLATVLVVLLIGWMYSCRSHKSQQVPEGPSASYIHNPTYDTTTSPQTTSMRYQQTTLTNSAARSEEGNGGALYSVLERPSAKDQPTSQQPERKEDEGGDYNVLSRDAMGLSYEVPTTTRNTREGLEEDDYQEPLDHLRNEFVMAQDHEVSVQVNQLHRNIG